MSASHLTHHHQITRSSHSINDYQRLCLHFSAADGSQAPPPPTAPSQRQGLSPAGIKGLVAAIFIALGLAGAAAGYVWYRRRNSRRDGFDSYGQTLGCSTFGQTFNWWGSGARFRWGDLMPWRWSAAARQRKYQQQVSLLCNQTAATSWPQLAAGLWFLYRLLQAVGLSPGMNVLEYKSGMALAVAAVRQR
jgi:hypothetical protein